MHNRKLFQVFVYTPDIEIWMAKLSFLPVDGFEEHTDHFIAYATSENALNEIQVYLDENEAGIESWYVNELEDKNWNAIWESTFKPVEIGRFCRIRASFHERKDDFRYSITIDPKMAFGTGHHATTYLMMSEMANLPFEGTMVLDYGTGTGVLAILAEMLGSSHIFAIDNEQNAVTNTLENISLNNCNKIQVALGEKAQLPQQQYDYILANINRNVILDSLKEIKQRMHDKSRTLFSGILKEDVELVERNLQKNEFTILKKEERDGWMMLLVSI